MNIINEIGISFEEAELKEVRDQLADAARILAEIGQELNGNMMGIFESVIDRYNKEFGDRQLFVSHGYGIPPKWRSPYRSPAPARGLYSNRGDALQLAFARLVQGRTLLFFAFLPTYLRGSNRAGFTSGSANYHGCFLRDR